MFFVKLFELFFWNCGVIFLLVLMKVLYGICKCDDWEKFCKLFIFVFFLLLCFDLVNDFECIWYLINFFGWGVVIIRLLGFVVESFGDFWFVIGDKFIWGLEIFWLWILGFFSVIMVWGFFGDDWSCLVDDDLFDGIFFVLWYFVCVLWSFLYWRFVMWEMFWFLFDLYEFDFEVGYDDFLLKILFLLFEKLFFLLMELEVFNLILLKLFLWLIFVLVFLVLWIEFLFFKLIGIVLWLFILLRV